MHRVFGRVVKFWLYAVYVILFAPILIVILMSFNQSQYGTFPIKLTLKWYLMLFNESSLLSATWLSISFSFWVAASAIIIGILTSIGMRSMSRKILNIFSMILSVPVIIPWLVLSTALLILFNTVGIGRSYLGMYLGNLTVIIPYVVFVVYGRLQEMDIMPELAAKTLGAGSLRILLNITLPDIFPAIMSGGLMAFIVCFNNFVIQYYLAPFGVRTLPLEIYNMVRVGFKPDLNALASIIILLSIVLVIFVYRLGFNVSSFKRPGEKS
ncbi:MAG TPA: ABC transporter permease [Ruminiclostridium sp.]|nr:ABC transporter permease [Ruminiclostridium sp.]